MKKNLLVAACFLCAGSLSAQIEPFKITMWSFSADSIRAVAFTEAAGIVSYQKPAPLYKGTYEVDKPKDWRFRFQGREGFMVNLRNDLGRNFQPHVWFEINGFSTYVSSSFGLGFVSRQERYAFGVIAGQYQKRVEGLADIHSNTNHYEKNFRIGCYLGTDFNMFLFSGTLIRERQGFYYRASAEFKPSSLITWRPIRTLGLCAEMETILGSDFGLVWRSPLHHETRERFRSAFRIAVQALYILPDRQERLDLRQVGVFAEEGPMLRLNLNWF